MSPVVGEVKRDEKIILGVNSVVTWGYGVIVY